MKKELFRRMLHMTAMFFLVYYLLPSELIPGFYKWQGLIIVLIMVLVTESIRLKKHAVFPGMRDYERTQISAFAWFAIGMTLALLFFKMQYVVPVIIGLALIDPLIGEIRQRRKKLYPTVPFVLYWIIMFICLLKLTALSLPVILILTSFGTLAAIYSESWHFKRIDDDFLMIVIPLLVLTGLDYIITS